MKKNILSKEKHFKSPILDFLATIWTCTFKFEMWYIASGALATFSCRLVSMENFPQDGNGPFEEKKARCKRLLSQNVNWALLVEYGILCSPHQERAALNVCYHGIKPVVLLIKVVRAKSVSLSWCNSPVSNHTACLPPTIVHYNANVVLLTRNYDQSCKSWFTS